MFNQKKHRVLLTQILKSIYSDLDLRTNLGFKGGSAAMMFYGLPRLSVDLDFDLLQPEKKLLVFERVKKKLSEFGLIREATEKKFTLFFLLSYEKGQRTVRIEISKWPGSNNYEVKSYLGISMLVVEQADMFAGKLAALLTRKKFAMRDVYDLWFFLDKNWPINEFVLKEKTELSFREALRKAIKKVLSVPQNQLLMGLGDLLETEKQKNWVREHLISDTIFLLKLRLENC